jgi:hypothetical protein
MDGASVERGVGSGLGDGASEVCGQNRSITLLLEMWRAVMAALRAHALPYVLDHADHIRGLLEQHAPEAAEAPDCYDALDSSLAWVPTGQH